LRFISLLGNAFQFSFEIHPRVLKEAITSRSRPFNSHLRSIFFQLNQLRRWWQSFQFSFEIHPLTSLPLPFLATFNSRLRFIAGLKLSILFSELGLTQHSHSSLAVRALKARPDLENKSLSRFRYRSKSYTNLPTRGGNCLTLRSPARLIHYCLLLALYKSFSCYHMLAKV